MHSTHTVKKAILFGWTYPLNGHFTSCGKNLHHFACRGLRSKSLLQIYVHCTVYSTLKKSYVESRQIKDDLETIIVDAAKRGGEENAGNAGLEL